MNLLLTFFITALLHFIEVFVEAKIDSKSKKVNHFVGGLVAFLWALAVSIYTYVYWIPNAQWSIMLVSLLAYLSVRNLVFDRLYNHFTGKFPWYVGETAWWDKIRRKHVWLAKPFTRIFIFMSVQFLWIHQLALAYPEQEETFGWGLAIFIGTWFVIGVTIHLNTTRNSR